MRKLILLIIVLGVATASSAVAIAAPAKNTTGTAYVGITHQEGDDLYVSGDFKDKLLGRGALVYVTRVSTSSEPGSFLVNARKITLYTRKGSLKGSGEAIQTINPDGSTFVSDGKFNLTRGTGAYKGHTLKGTFDGTYADGVYTFDYEAKYKKKK